jgi:hypothetical protein
MTDLSMYRFGKVGKNDVVHIVLDGKTICNSKECTADSDLTAKDVTCRRCINPMHKYKPYNDLVALADKAAG